MEGHKKTVESKKTVFMLLLLERAMHVACVLCFSLKERIAIRSVLGDGDDCKKLVGFYFQGAAGDTIETDCTLRFVLFYLFCRSFGAQAKRYYDSSNLLQFMNDLGDSLSGRLAWQIV